MPPAPHPWNSLLTSLPYPHFLQTREWGQVKERYGWQSLYGVWDNEGVFRLDPDPQAVAAPAAHVRGAVLILSRTVRLAGLSAPWKILYLPKGPNLDWSDAPFRRSALADLQRLATDQRAIFVKLDPDIVLGRGEPGSEDDHLDKDGEAAGQELSGSGWRFSPDQIQFRNTVLLDLTASEEVLLARMKPKTRYNIRLAARKDVRVRVGDNADFPLLYRMYAETSARDGFVIRNEAYYQTVWSVFQERSERDPSQPYAEPLIAEVDGEPVAAVVVFYFGGRAYYVYGMSRESHREKMPNYVLQWEAMRRAKAEGCSIYDLWGAPDDFSEPGGMAGVFRFKQGLGGEVVRTLGAWDFAPSRFMYNLYSGVMPRILDFMRRRGASRTRQIIGA
jgi:peptidoglycan pentaglycine glycine transferase (the first glycine)